MMRSFLFLLLLFVVACSPTAPSPVAPPLARLSARATAVVEDNSIRFQLDSDAPLARAQLLYGAEGGYAPLDVPVMAESRSASYRLNLSGGLALPRGLSELRYGWIVTGVNGETLAIAQGFT